MKVKGFAKKEHFRTCRCRTCDVEKSPLPSRPKNLKVSKKSPAIEKSPEVKPVDSAQHKLNLHKRPMTAATFAPMQPTTETMFSTQKKTHDFSTAGWSDFDENFYRCYRSEMRERLGKQSRTGPWE
jgi:hypothetical protein